MRKCPGGCPFLQSGLSAHHWRMKSGTLLEINTLGPIKVTVAVKNRRLHHGRMGIDRTNSSKPDLFSPTSDRERSALSVNRCRMRLEPVGVRH